MHTVDEYASRNLDSSTRLRVEDTDGPHWLGFNCVSASGCFLTEITPDRSEQIHLTREQIEWLAAEGLPALLREMAA
jgi:hypothetical protein